MNEIFTLIQVHILVWCESFGWKVLIGKTAAMVTYERTCICKFLRMQCWKNKFRIKIGLSGIPADYERALPVFLIAISLQVLWTKSCTYTQFYPHLSTLLVSKLKDYFHVGDHYCFGLASQFSWTVCKLLIQRKCASTWTGKQLSNHHIASFLTDNFRTSAMNHIKQKRLQLRAWHLSINLKALVPSLYLLSVVPRLKCTYIYVYMNMDHLPSKGFKQLHSMLSLNRLTP